MWGERVERLRQSTDTRNAWENETERLKKKRSRWARATCTPSPVPTLLEYVDIDYHRWSTLGMPEIHLEARSDVCFELQTMLVRGEDKTTPMWTPHQALTGVWRKTSTILTQEPRATERHGETPGVRGSVERLGDVKGRPGCSAIETGLMSLSGPLDALRLCGLGSFQAFACFPPMM